MASDTWWRRVADHINIPDAGSGSWARRIAVAMGLSDEPGSSWEEKIANHLGVRRIRQEDLDDLFAQGKFDRLQAIPTGTRIAILGDSRTAGAYTGSDTIQEHFRYIDWLQLYAGGKVIMYPTDDYGNGGDTTLDMLNRIETVAASVCPLVAFLGGTNDRGSAGFSLLQSQRYFRAIYERLVLQAGKQIIACSEIQRFGGSALSGGQLANHIAWHEWLESLRWPGLLVANAWDDVVSADLYDGLHPLIQGQQKIGTKMGQALIPYLSSTPLLPIAGNVAVNPTMTGTGGSKSGTGVTGEVADSWSLVKSATNAGTLALVGSKVTTEDKIWQQIVVTGLPTGTNTPVLRQDITLAAAGLVVGDTVEAMVEWWITQAVNVSGCPWRMQGLQADGSTQTFSALSGDSDSSRATSFIAAARGTRRIRPIVIPALTDRIRIFVMMQFIALDIQFTGRFTLPTLRKV